MQSFTRYLVTPDISWPIGGKRANCVTISESYKKNMYIFFLHLFDIYFRKIWPTTQGSQKKPNPNRRLIKCGWRMIKCGVMNVLEIKKHCQHGIVLTSQSSLHLLPVRLSLFLIFCSLHHCPVLGKKNKVDI